MRTEIRDFLESCGFDHEDRVVLFWILLGFVFLAGIIFALATSAKGKR